MAENNNSTQNLLDIDLDAVVTKGKAKTKRKKALFVTMAALIIIAIVIGGILLKASNDAKAEEAYQEAMELIDLGLYGDAATKFDEAGEHKDSKTMADKARFAQEYELSLTYASLQVSIQEAFAQTNSKVFFSYDWENKTVMQNNLLEDLGAANFEELIPDTFIAWEQVCTAINASSAACYEANVADDYDVNWTINVYGNDEELLYTATNGVTEFNYVDLDAVKEEFYETVYSNIVEAVEQGNFPEAVSFWNNFNATEAFSLDYKDLSDYYYYAGAMEAYRSTEVVSLSAAMENFEKVSAGFKDVDSCVEEISAMLEAVDGEYQYQNGKYTHTLTIDGGKIVFVHDQGPYLVPERYSTSNAAASAEKLLGYVYTEPSYVVQNGTIKEMKVLVAETYGMYAFSATFTFNEDGLTVECGEPGSSYSYEKWDSKNLAGRYIKQ